MHRTSHTHTHARPHARPHTRTHACPLTHTFTHLQARWVRVLSQEYPTLAFHASITNPFGKGVLCMRARVCVCACVRACVCVCAGTRVCGNSPLTHQPAHTLAHHARALSPRLTYPQRHLSTHSHIHTHNKLILTLTLTLLTYVHSHSLTLPRRLSDPIAATILSSPLREETNICRIHRLSECACTPNTHTHTHTHAKTHTHTQSASLTSPTSVSRSLTPFA